MLAGLRRKAGADRVALTTGDMTETPHHLGFDGYVDRVRQILVSYHDFLWGDRVRTVSVWRKP